MRVLVRSVLIVAAAICVLGVAVAAQTKAIFPPLETATDAGWRDYAAATEQRIADELKSPSRFLALDFGTSAGADRKAVLAGGMPIAEMHTQNKKTGRTIDVPDAWVHHWRGAVLVPNVRLNQVFERLKAEVPGIGKGDVVAARIEHEPRMRTFIKLQRSGIGYNFVYLTEHDVLFTLLTGGRGTSTSAATKIVQLSNPGTPQEREFRADEDHRLLQRWNSYWRYEEVPGRGVIVECESITLSRSVWLGLFRGIAASTARESMQKALVNLSGHFATAAQKQPVSSPVR